MKLEIEKEDIQAIAREVVGMIKPLLVLQKRGIIIIVISGSMGKRSGLVVRVGLRERLI